MYCTNCDINWASLASQDDPARDETYCFCPLCRSDMDLVENIDGPRYVYSMLTGEVVDVETKEPLTISSPINYIPEKPFDRVAWEKKKEERETRELVAIDAYVKEYESGGQGAGAIAYREIFTKSKNSL